MAVGVRGKYSPREVLMGRWRQWMLALLVLLAVSGSSFTAGIAAERSGVVPGAVRAEPSGLVDQFSVFWQAWDLVNQHFVDRSALDPRKLTYGAIDGMLNALGDTGHTRFLSPEQAAVQTSDIAGQFEGIGAQLGLRDGYPVIVAPLDGSPAEKAGLQAGDVIVQVNGQSVAGASLDQVVGMVRGPEGTTVKLTIIHPGQGSLTEISIQRAKIQVHPVSWGMIPGTKLAHLRISQFTATTNQELLQAIKEIRAAGAQGLVVDVRSNPGGLLDQAVSVTSEFLTSGSVLLDQDAQGNRKPIAVQPGGQATDLPMVTLINLGTASAAEIFAGAMQDYHRGEVIGDTSFGTGTVLSGYDLSDGSMLLLGTSEWLTPHGRQIWKQGIAPDVAVSLAVGSSPLTPAKESGMTEDQIRSSGDAQLLKAMDLLSK
jgi:carboxyl-terminal processing protease